MLGRFLESNHYFFGWAGCVGVGGGGWVGREMNVKARLRSISSEIANWS